MGERRALVIGARNDRFGRLDFVDQVARDLHKTVLDDQLGACVPALPDGRELLIGDAASCAGIKAALADALLDAATSQATLFVYFLGHGHREDEDFYLIGTDTPGPERVDSESAVPIGQRVKELLRQNATVDGFMLILDACHSGAAITDPVPGLLRSGVTTRMEILAATREDQTASNGCFSRSIIELLTRGSAATADEYLRAYDEHSRLREVAPAGCQNMPTPVHVSLSGGIDAGLWLGRNRIADVHPALASTRAAAEVARLTRSLVQTTYLDKLLALRWSGRSPIGITGGAGTGKSTLLAALSRASIAGYGRADALVTVRPGDTLATIAASMSMQLQASSIYQAASVQWNQQTPAVERANRSLFDRLIVGPVSNLASDARLLVGVDGVDNLRTLDRRRLLESFTDKPGATLVVAGRNINYIHADATLMLPDRDQGAVAVLLANLVSDEDARAKLSVACAGDWLLARILSGLWKAGSFK